jgi:hypothetical protein
MAICNPDDDQWGQTPARRNIIGTTGMRAMIGYAGPWMWFAQTNSSPVET